MRAFTPDYQCYTKDFDITVDDPCSTATLTAATTAQTTYTVEMFETFSEVFTAAVNSAAPTDCGTINYSMYSQGTTNTMTLGNGLPDVTITGSPTYTFDGQVTYTNGGTVFLGSYNMEIYAKFASYTNSATSVPITLTVTDPCVTTIT